MTIETKFNIGDYVWFMHKLEPISAKVTSFTIYVDKTIVIEYFFEKPFEFRREKYLFRTKARIIG